MTLVPWIKGQPLVWDVTVVDTLADSYVLKSSEVSGFAAELACKRKHSKYSSIISSNYVFKGLAFETLGPWCKEAIDFINVIGNRLIAESGDSKSKKFLFERILPSIIIYFTFDYNLIFLNNNSFFFMTRSLFSVPKLKNNQHSTYFLRRCAVMALPFFFILRWVQYD
jgi:hypothetical protein